MKRRSRRRLVLSVTALSVLAAGLLVGRQLYIGRPGYGLPYHARFVPEVKDLWTALGGTWEVVEGSMRNDSNDRGAKLLTGSPNWKDYIVEGDLQLLGSGSVGVLARVSEAELGENSHKGYWAGVRTVDDSLVLGAYDFAYHEAARTPMPEPVRPFRWYHVRLRVEGCRITASAWAVGMREIKTAPLNDPDCFPSCRAGLRSNGTGGIWRNVAVLPVDAPAANSPAHELPSPDVTAFRHALLQTGIRSGGTQPPGEGAPSGPAQPVNTLPYMPQLGAPLATVRGSVVLTRPSVYVQDSTGGVEVESDSLAPLKIGDEVEVTGELSLDQFSPVLRKAQFRLLREAGPVSPAVATVNQVASA
ncbi:MAG: hypothetical protein ABUS51_03930, partial [Acidobacteriota bacterium]